MRDFFPLFTLKPVPKDKVSWNIKAETSITLILCWYQANYQGRMLYFLYFPSISFLSSGNVTNNQKQLILY